MDGMRRRRAIMKQAAAPEPPAEKWSYSYANGDMVKYIGNYAQVPGVNDQMCIRTSTNRWSFCLTDGTNKPLRTGPNAATWDQLTVIEPHLYPIPIPRTAVAVTTTATFKNNTGQVQTDCAIVDSDGEYPRTLQTGWKANPYRLTFTAGQYDYIFPKVSADVTEITVVFEE